MSNVLIKESTMTSIANAIRTKLNSTEQYLPSEMPSAIEDISSGGNYWLSETIETFAEAKGE